MITKKEKNMGITLIALVITIVIMLLLAGVVLQIAMGENGLIAKSVQAQKEQAKAELYAAAKLSYANLNAKALENGQPSPNAELVLSTTEFRDRYDIVGDDITDKNGNVIDTKANVLNVIQGTVAGGFSSGTSTGGTSSTESWPKTVGGVTIPEEDKDKMICKLVVKKNTEVMFGASSTDPIEVDYGNGVIAELYYPEQKAYNRGEYILKFKNITDLRIGIINTNDFEIEIIQWGNIKENSTLEIYSVSKIYEPEPDKIPVKYINAKFTEIPEWLFSKKITSTVMSTFEMCTGLTRIPEELFKNNANVTSLENTFKMCTGLTSIPETIVEFAKKVKERGGDSSRIFWYCISASNYSSIPSYMK